MEFNLPKLTPYIVVKDTIAAIAFYEKAFGATSSRVMKGPDGKVMNAQIAIGDSAMMLNDEFPDYGVFAPKPGESLPVTFHLTSQDVDADFQRAVDAGAEVTMPLADQFWGDRYGQVRDPFGYNWSMGQKVKDVTPEDMEAAMGEMG